MSQPIYLVKLEAILWESHEADEDAVTHLGVAVLVGIEEVVLTAYLEPFARQLRPVPAMMFHLQSCARLSPLPGVWEEAQGEFPIGQLADLPRPLQGGDAIHDDGLTLLALVIHVDANLVRKNRGAKDTGLPERRHISRLP